MSSGAANLTCPNSIAAVSFIDAFGICLIMKWKQQYHFGLVVFVIPFTDISMNRCVFSILVTGKLQTISCFFRGFKYSVSMDALFKTNKSKLVDLKK